MLLYSFSRSYKTPEIDDVIFSNGTAVPNLPQKRFLVHAPRLKMMCCTGTSLVLMYCTVRKDEALVMMMMILYLLPVLRYPPT